MKIGDIDKELDKQTLPALLNAQKGLAALAAVLPNKLWEEIELASINALIIGAATRKNYGGN